MNKGVVLEIDTVVAIVNQFSNILIYISEIQIYIILFGPYMYSLFSLTAFTMAS